MSGGTVSNNTSTTLGGGGIWVDQQSTLAVNAGQIRSNRSPAGSGGGIFTANYANIRIAAPVVFSGNTAASAIDIGMTSSEYVAVFQTALSPNGIYSPWSPGGYSTCPGFTAAHPMNNYDINVIVLTITEKFRDTNGAPIPGRPDTTTFVYYGKTYTKDPIPAIPGYRTVGYFVGATFTPPGDVATPATSVTRPNIQNNLTIFFVYREITYTTLTISKQVTGDYGQRNKLWTFTVYLEDDEGNALTNPYPFTIQHRDGTSSVGTLTPNATNGSVTFELKHGDVISLGEVRRDAVVRVVETPDGEYAASYIDSINPTTKVSSSATPKLAMSENRRFDFTNAYDDTPEAGIRGGDTPVVALSVLLLGATGAVIAYMARRRIQVF